MHNHSSADRWAQRVATVLMCVAGVATAATPVDQANSDAGFVLPTDAELERLGARFGTIEIDNQDVFDEHDQHENHALFRLSNRLHIETRPELIEQQLLFKSDDRFSRQLIDESARILRANRYFYNADIVPVRYVDGRVDVRVTTRDVWSLNPGLSFSRRGGRSTYGIEFEELNLLGQGVSVGVHHKSGIDRDVRGVDFVDRHLLGQRIELAANYESNSDGDVQHLSLQRPFYALDTRFAIGGSVERVDRVDPLYALGEIDSQFRERSNALNLFGGWSSGLRDGWVRRWLVGYALDRREFDALPGAVENGPLPENRDLSYPWIGVEIVQDEFSSLHNHDQIGRTEDFLLGTRFAAKLGYSSAGLGADRDSLIYQASFDHGMTLSPQTMFTLSSTLDGRWDERGARGLWFDSSARYYHQQGEQWLLFASLDANYTHAPDIERQLLLGGDNGLRGYPLRYQAGDASARFTVEERFFSDWYPFRLFRVGGAAFFDAGRTFGHDPLGTPNFGLLKDVGVGLRLGNSRSGNGSVIHVDLAFPLDGPSDLKGMQFLIETRKAF